MTGDSGVENRDLDALAPGGVVPRYAKPLEGGVAKSHRPGLGRHVRKLRNRDHIVCGKFLIVPEEGFKVREIVEPDAQGAEAVEAPEKTEAAAVETGQEILVGLVGGETHQAFVGDTEEQILEGFVGL